MLRQLALLEAPDADEVKTAADGLQAAASALRDGRHRGGQGARDRGAVGGRAHVPRTSRRSGLSGVRRRSTQRRVARGDRGGDRPPSSAGGAGRPGPPVDGRVDEERLERICCRFPPLSSASEIGLEVEDLIGAWKTWSAGASIEESEALAQHLAASLPSVAEGVEKLKATASRELQRRKTSGVRSQPISRDGSTPRSEPGAGRMC